jgi:hypothetical protein
MRLILLLSFLFISVFANMSDLLTNLAQEDDLSAQTKQESTGSLTVYTRADLDQMKLRSLQELISQIPFIRYNESRSGFSDPVYQPYQPSLASAVKVYIDDREIVSPYYGNGLQLFAQISLDSIDHIEVYMGISSQNFGLRPAITTIKCYTKIPSREETTLIGTNYGLHNTNKLYGYSAHAYKEYQYLVSASHEDINGNHLQHNQSSLSKDKQLDNIYAKVIKGNLIFDAQVAHGKADAFMGNSYNIDPINPQIDFNYYYAGLYYDNKENGLRVSASFTYDTSNSYDDSYSVLGSIPTSIPPGYTTYNTSDSNIKESLTDLKLFKTFKTTRNSLMLGLQGRVEHFDIASLKLGNVTIPKTVGYNRESILSISAEEKYLFNRSNLLVVSALYNKNYENSVVRNYTTTSARIGYIYNKDHITSKNFLFYGELSPSMGILYDNRAYYNQTTDPDKNRGIAFSSKLSYTQHKYTTSLLYGHSILKKMLYFDGTGYKNLPEDYVADSLSYRYTYRFSASDRILFNSWIQFENNKNLSANPQQRLGGFVTLFNQIGKVKLYNNLVYKKWDDTLKEGFNFNSTITYVYSKDLNLYVKANNLFNKALQSNYYSTNPLTSTTSTLNSVNIIDQMVLVGLEYQF